MLEYGLLIILTLSIRGLDGVPFEGDIAVPALTSGNTQVAHSFVVEKSNKLWKHGIVKYRFEVYPDENGIETDWFTEQEKADIRSAMAHIAEKVPCIQFM